MFLSFKIILFTLHIIYLQLHLLTRNIQKKGAFIMEGRLRKYADLVICSAGAGVLIYLFIRFVPGIIMPFFLGWLTSLLIFPLAKKISSRSKMTLKQASVMTTVLFFFFSALGLGLAVKRLTEEVVSLIERLYREPELIAKAYNTVRGRLQLSDSGKLSFIDKLAGVDGMERIAHSLDELISKTASGFVELLTSKIPSLTAGAVTTLPEILLFIISFLLSAFYFCVDRDKISKFTEGIFPESLRAKIPLLKERAGIICSRYLKAYLLIMLITFGEIFLGLSVLRVSYAFLLAVIIAAIDVLPILGAGAVLIPWAIYSFAISDSRMGIGLLIIFAIVTVVRQIIEPRIVGKSIGLHPLAMLFSVYAGIKLLGFGGLILGPIVALIIKGLFSPSERTERTSSVKDV